MRMLPLWNDEVECTGCRESKPRSDFYSLKKSGDPRQPCKECYRLWHRSRYTPKHEANDDPRTCKICGSSFVPKTRRVAYYCSDPCKSKARAPKLRDQWLREKYGIGADEYDALLAEQGGGCAICGRAQGSIGRFGILHVDHDHATGAVRGILCQQCNHGLGNFRDEPALLERAVAYLRGDLTAPTD